MTTHALSRIDEYRIWASMKNRCHNPRDQGYAGYGGRGIQVCPRWRDSFENFIADMGRRPSKKHSIDRIENAGDYEPSNCRWATWKEQNNNLRTNRLLTLRGTTKTIHQWADEKGVDAKTLDARLRDGWSVEATLTRPVQARGKTLPVPCCVCGAQPEYHVTKTTRKGQFFCPNCKHAPDHKSRDRYAARETWNAFVKRLSKFFEG
jgi:hypothetical protein